MRGEGTEGARGGRLRYIAGAVKLNLKLDEEIYSPKQHISSPYVVSLCKSLRGAPSLPAAGWDITQEIDLIYGYLNFLSALGHFSK